MVFVLPIAYFLIVHQVAEGLRGDGDGVRQDHSTVATRSQHQLVVEVVETNTPNPIQLERLDIKNVEALK